MPSPLSATAMPGLLGMPLAPVVLAERDLEVLGLVGVLAAMARPVGGPARDVLLHGGPGDDVRPVAEVAHLHAVEMRELLLALHALDDAPALVVDDPRALPEVRVVD